MVGALIVLFNPQREKILEALSVLYPQVDCVLLVDNSAEDNARMYLDIADNIEYIPLLGNQGIAKAQNIGIQRLHERGMKYVLFSDQDSVCQPQIVEHLLRGHATLSKELDIAAVGAIAVNARTGAVYLHKDNARQRGNINGIDYVITGHVMSSFSLMDLTAFERVGLYNESLFIDSVETSWCFRASYYFGMRSYLLPAAQIEHELGHPTRFLGRNISISNPLRLYYQLRNILWESSEEYSPCFWKKRCRKALAGKVIHHPLFCRHRWQYVKSIWRGLRDGLMRKHKMNIPQYDGSDPCLTGEWTFNDWIAWYQVQPLDAPMKKLYEKIPHEPQPEPLPVFRMLCFAGEINGVEHNGVFTLTHDDNDTFNQITSVRSDKIDALRDEVRRACADIAFVCLDVVCQDGEPTICDYRFYPWNGAAKMPDEQNHALGRAFMQSYTALKDRKQNA